MNLNPFGEDPSMSPLPHDFEPDVEQEIYDIFGALRREVYAAIKDLARQIFSRIELEQAEDERTAQPDMLQVIEQSLFQLLQVIVKIFQPDGSPTAPPRDPSAPDEEEDRVVRPKIRRSGRKSIEEWRREDE